MCYGTRWASGSIQRFRLIQKHTLILFLENDTPSKRESSAALHPGRVFCYQSYFKGIALYKYEGVGASVS